MNNNERTIAAIATGLVNSGISIIRMSGPEAVAIADSVFVSPHSKSLKDVRSHTINYGYIKDGGETVDEVMVSVMRAPKTYTREDCVEINCHGGITVTSKVFDLLLKKGAHVAEPGEFTKRAFLNGRIDLSEAEAVLGVINAKNEHALKSSMDNLCGRLGGIISGLRNEILKDTAFIEAALDDPEHISLDGFSSDLRDHVLSWQDRLNALMKSFKEGRLIREGIRTVIIGKPNSGKSTLLNLLLGSDRAIVTDVAGTTRDTIEESLTISGITLNIADTAGIRDTADQVEKIGVERSLKLASTADLVLFVADSSTGVDESDRRIIDLIKDKNSIVLYNKIDLGGGLDREKLEAIFGSRIIDFSSKEGIGLGLLAGRIKEMFFEGRLESGDEVFLSSKRQEENISSASRSLSNVLAAIDDDLSEDFYTIDLMDAYTSLGFITGESVSDDLADMIFKEFCMGK